MHNIDLCHFTYPPSTVHAVICCYYSQKVKVKKKDEQLQFGGETDFPLNKIYIQKILTKT